MHAILIAVKTGYGYVHSSHIATRRLTQTGPFVCMSPGTDTGSAPDVELCLVLTRAGSSDMPARRYQEIVFVATVEGALSAPSVV